MNTTILFEKKENVGIIRLNRPEVLNSFNREMALLMQETLKRCETDETIRCILITGEGRAFCAGQDLQEATSGTLELRTIVKEHYNPIIHLIRSIEKPIVAAVNGVAAGAGANIALACDIVTASDKASFIQAFSKIGLIPDSGGTFTLPRLIGLQRASALMMLGEKITAEEAEKMGMIYRCYAEQDFWEQSCRIAAQLSQMPTRGLGLTKRALNLSMFNTLEDQLNLEEDLQSEAGNTYDYREGVSAFLEKRTPAFRGQ